MGPFYFNAAAWAGYDATELTSGLTEVLCYGTAVVVEHADNQ